MKRFSEHTTLTGGSEQARPVQASSTQFTLSEYNVHVCSWKVYMHVQQYIETCRRYAFAL